MDTLVDLVNHPIFDQIVTNVLGLMDSKITKQLLLVARHMGLADGWGNFRDLTSDVTQLLIQLPFFNGLDTSTPEEHEQLSRKILQDFFRHPLYSGAIIMATQINPKTRETVQKEKLESLLKEINVMDTPGYDPLFDYSAFFGKYDVPIHSEIPSNDRMARVVHKAIDLWVSRVEEKIQYPKMSKKCLPSFTREELHRYIDILVEDPSIATPGSLERLYVKEGIYLDGPCEVSQRWYMHGLTPRTYFVAGATAYNDTKYTKWMWNELVDCLSVTNRRNRVNPRRIYVQRMKEAFFYDLTSFTSNMGAQRSFIEALATYCTGVHTTVMDSYYGPRSVPLDDLIRTYNQMNSFPEYRCAEFDSVFPDTHGVAGFLGVFGNIATCTFLHGAVLLQLADHEHECGCAGDDAVICTTDDGLIYGCINLLGVLAIEKTFSTRDIDVVYLKRRTWIDSKDFCLKSKPFVQIPSMLPWIDTTKEYRFTREASLSRREKFDLAASSLQATFRSVSSIWDKRSTLEEIHQFVERYYRKCGFPIDGNVPQFSSMNSVQSSRFIPSLVTLGYRDWVEATLATCYPGECWLPDRSERMTWGIEGRSGTIFRARGSEYLQFLVRLGYIQRKYKPKVHYVGEEGLQKSIQEFTSRDPAWFVYEIVEEVPVYLRGGMEHIEGLYEVEYLPGYIESMNVDQDELEFEGSEIDEWDDDTRGD